MMQLIVNKQDMMNEHLLQVFIHMRSTTNRYVLVVKPRKSETTKTS